MQQKQPTLCVATPRSEAEQEQEAEAEEQEEEEEGRERRGQEGQEVVVAEEGGC